MQVPERLQIINVLNKKIPEFAFDLEQQIFIFVYHRAEDLHIELNWNNKLFLELYQINAYRIINNIKYGFIKKYLENGENVMSKKDIELSDMHAHLIIKESNSVSEKFLKDIPCNKCGKFTVKMQKKQVRCIDEGFTAIFRCHSCNYSRTEN